MEPYRITSTKPNRLGARCQIVQSSFPGILKRVLASRSGGRARTPDALIIATALVLGIEGIQTNDVRLEAYEPEGVDILLLSRFVV